MSDNTKIKSNDILKHLKLVFPDESHERAWHVIVDEFKCAGEKIIPYALWLGIDSYADFLTRTNDFHNGINIPDNRVPGSTYFLMHNCDGNGGGKILGAVNIRHRLNEGLTKIGGHIGYGIAPSERRKGYATALLALALGICRRMGIDRALVTCDKINVGSARTIIKNGGILENEITDEDGVVVQRYWIDI